MTSLTSCTGWGGVGWGINVLCSKNFQLRRWLPTTLASNYVAIFSTNLASTLASLVRNLSSTLLSSLSTSNYVSDVSDWQNLGTDVTKPWRRTKDRFHVPKPWPHCRFVKWPTKNWILFWGLGMKCPYLMASAQKNMDNKTNGIETHSWQLEAGGRWRKLAG